MKNLKNLSLLSMVFCAVVLFATAAHSQEEETQSSTHTTTKTTTKVKERKAILNFEDELVEGSTQKPELFYLFQKKNFNYNRLIKLRENFLPEMRQTTEHIQRVRGVN